MAHCPYDQLSDLEELLDEVRQLPLLREAKPGIFYFKNQSFLHFHINKDGRRWADARDESIWGSEIEIPFNAKKSNQKVFLKEVIRRYQTQVK